jgi:predicted nucleic acid-binding protein
MSSVVILDSGPVGTLTNPGKGTVPVAIRQWLADLISSGRRVILPEVVDFEVRREYLRAGLTRSLKLLDGMPPRVEYLPISTLAMRIAADLWAKASNAGLPIGSRNSLAADVVLAGQALALNVQAIVATGNPAHLSRFLPADLWSNIV